MKGEREGRAGGDGPNTTHRGGVGESRMLSSGVMETGGYVLPRLAEQPRSLALKRTRKS